MQSQLFESLLPASRKFRAIRHKRILIEKKKLDAARTLILKQVLKAEEISRNQWKEELTVHAEKLASLIVADNANTDAEVVAASIGVKAWSMGGLTCMKFLHEMTMDICRDQNTKSGEDIVDTIPMWWDGIGRWQNSSIV